MLKAFVCAVVTIAATAWFAQGAHANHLFSQSGEPNAPLSAGESVELTFNIVDVVSQGGFSFAQARFEFNGDWNSGDSLRVNGTTLSFGISFDSVISGSTQTNFIMNSNTQVFPTPLSFLFDDAVVGNVLRIDAVSGSFTLLGFSMDARSNGLRKTVVNTFVDSNGTRTLHKGFLVGSVSPTPSSDLPEPGTLALFAIGLAGLGVLRRRPIAQLRATAPVYEMR